MLSLKGIEINATDKNDDTALDLAVKMECPYSVKALRESGCEMKPENVEKATEMIKTLDDEQKYEEGLYAAAFPQKEAVTHSKKPLHLMGKEGETHDKTSRSILRKMLPLLIPSAACWLFSVDSKYCTGFAVGCAVTSFAFGAPLKKDLHVAGFSFAASAIYIFGASQNCKIKAPCVLVSGLLGKLASNYAISENGEGVAL